MKDVKYFETYISEWFVLYFCTQAFLKYFNLPAQLWNWITFGPFKLFSQFLDQKVAFFKENWSHFLPTEILTRQRKCLRLKYILNNIRIFDLNQKIVRNPPKRPIFFTVTAVTQCTLGKSPQGTKEPLCSVFFCRFQWKDRTMHHEWAVPNWGNAWGSVQSLHYGNSMVTMLPKNPQPSEALAFHKKCRPLIDPKLL